MFLSTLMLSLTPKELEFLRQGLTLVLEKLHDPDMPYGCVDTYPEYLEYIGDDYLVVQKLLNRVNTELVATFNKEAECRSKLTQQAQQPLMIAITGLP